MFYSRTRDTQQDSALVIEFKLYTGALCSISNDRTLWEIWQLQQQKNIQKSTKLSKTHSGEAVFMIGYATIAFSFDPDGLFVFHLMV